MNALARNLPLPAAPVPVTPPDAPPRSHRQRKQCWLALHFTDWSLHAALHALTASQRAGLAQQPLAVLDHDRQRRVLAANAAALAQGVRPGHTLNAALALCAQLQLLPRDASAESRLLISLAEWAQRYTPFVSVEAPNELLLEVRGSLRLFGGVTALLTAVQQALQQHLQASMALSPIARASLCLARGRDRSERAIVVMPKQLKAVLSTLPLSHLYWPVEIELRLARFGVTRLGELWRLPRADLARRIGVRYLRELDALLGRQIELRQSFKTMPVYRDHIVLDFEISSTTLLEQVLSSALNRLQKYLREYDLALGRVHIEFKHREHEATRFSVGLAMPTADMQRVAALLHEQLSRLVLPAPVLEIKLCVKQLLAAQGTAADLLAGIAHHGSALSQRERLGCLLERLQARLGKQAIRSLQLHADHRPECAQVTQPAKLESKSFSTTPALTTSLSVRPLWLLPEPIAVKDGAKPPHELQLIQGPERIEAGWWNDAPIKRDYYVAKYGNQSCWVFKNLMQGSGWYVHGWFG